MSAYQARRKVDGVEWMVSAVRPPGGGFRNRRLFIDGRRANGLEVAFFAFLVRGGRVRIRRDALPDDVLGMLRVAEQMTGADD